MYTKIALEREKKIRIGDMYKRDLESVANFEKELIC